MRPCSSKSTRTWSGASWGCCFNHVQSTWRSPSVGGGGTLSSPLLPAKRVSKIRKTRDTQAARNPSKMGHRSTSRSVLQITQRLEQREDTLTTKRTVGHSAGTLARLTLKARLTRYVMSCTLQNSATRQSCFELLWALREMVLKMFF